MATVRAMDTGSDLENIQDRYYQLSSLTSSQGVLVIQDRYYQLSSLTSSQGLLVILRELGTLCNRINIKFDIKFFVFNYTLC